MGGISIGTVGRREGKMSGVDSKAGRHQAPEQISWEGPLISIGGYVFFTGPLICARAFTIF